MTRTALVRSPEDYDPVAEVLRALRLRAARCARVVLGEPWAVVLPPVPHLQLHFLIDGCLWLQDAGRVRHTLQAPAAWLIPSGAGYRLGAGRATKPLHIDVAPNDFRPGYTRVLGGSGRRATLVCVECEQGALATDPFGGVWPSCITLRAPDSTLGSMIELLDRCMADASAGSSIIALRLAELSLLAVLRSWLGSPELEAQRGWLTTLRQPGLSRALGAMMAEPAAAHDVDSLARLAGMSRSTFAETFREQVGVAPLAWLRRWRLHRAADRLQEGETVERAASSVGFDSASAFSRAFARELGQRPGEWRQRTSQRTV